MKYLWIVVPFVQVTVEKTILDLWARHVEIWVCKTEIHWRLGDGSVNKVLALQAWNPAPEPT